MSEYDKPNLLNTVSCMDIFDLCDCLQDESIDMILCDLPYGITACEWDHVIPFAPMWEAFKRIIKPHGAIVLTGKQPFSSQLIMSNLDMFKYEWIWKKSQPSGHLNANKRPMVEHEQIVIFSNGTCAYYPQFTKKLKENLRTERTHQRELSNNYGKFAYGAFRTMPIDIAYPKSVIEFPNQQSYNHPTEKPIDLFEYLVRTYTEPSAVIFDPCVGSGTTAIAARNTARNFICGDINEEYAQIARDRLAQPYTIPMFDEIQIIDDVPVQTDMFGSGA